MDSEPVVRDTETGSLGNSRNSTSQPDFLCRPYRSGDEVAFRELNEEWIKAYFVLEDKDRTVLNDPIGKILRPGGHIFVATEKGHVIGCCALLAMGSGTFEVAKMAVSPAYRGRGIGRQLLQFVVDQAKRMQISRLYLETNSKLKNAIHLYSSTGFRHIPADRVQPTGYARADVYMEMLLS